jgi:hypothetical protein
VSDRWLDSVRRDFAALDDRESARTACPAPEAIWGAVHAAASAREARAIAEHVAACPSCAADWRLAMRAPDRPVAAEVATAERSRRLFPRLVPLAAVSAAALLAAVALFVVRQGQAPPSYRMPERAQIGSLLADGAALNADRFILQWSPGPEGTRYAVRVSTRQLTRLAGAEALVEPRYQVPREALSRLGHGDVVLWQVEAILPDGRRLASGTFTVRVE